MASMSKYRTSGFHSCWALRAHCACTRLVYSQHSTWIRNFIQSLSQLLVCVGLISVKTSTRYIVSIDRLVSNALFALFRGGNARRRDHILGTVLAATEVSFLQTSLQVK